MLISSEPIKVKEGVDVELSISIESDGLPVWLYSYVTLRASETFKGSSDDGGPATRQHELGAISKLDKHDWDIGLGWGGEKEEKVTVKLVWKQKIGGKEKVLYEHTYAERTLKKGSEAAVYQSGAYFQPVSKLPESK